MNAERWKTRVALLFVGAALAATFVLASGSTAEALLLRNTLKLAGGAALAAVPVSLALAAALARFRVFGRGAAVAMLAAFLFVPLYIQAAAWEAGFGRQGWWPLIFGSLAAPPLSDWRGALFVHAVAAIPWATLMILAGLRHLPAEWEEAASLDGSAWQVLRRVTLPLALPATLAAALWTFVAAAGEIVVADLYRVSTYAREVYQGFALADAPLSASSGWASVVPAGTLILLLGATSLAIVRLLAPRAAMNDQRPATITFAGPRSVVAMVLVWTAISLLTIVPLASLAVNAGLTVRLEGAAPVREWSLTKALVITAESPRRYGDAIRWTLLIAAVASTLSVALAAPLAWLACRRRAGAAIAMAVAAAALAVPGPMVGLAVIWLLNRPESDLLNTLYDRTIAAPVLAITFRALPLPLLILWHALRSISPETIDAARLDGAGAIRRFLLVALPQRKASLAAAWLVAFALAQAELSASILVLPPGIDTLSRRVWGLIHFGVMDQVAGVCLMVFFVSFAVGLAAMRLATERHAS